ncbi:hypothetical protein PR048_019810 [Dryococelus australis]|uniref:Uncharacterized protein n=1 Tax=Dryococelus australis TaxID=614101 RepID=A0ABQ9H4L4_9NEOP|nr:hypothetical protein PR048_019810 [Dryococelus australis]
MKGRGKREIPEKTRRPTASSGTITTCENPGIEPGSPWWQPSVLIAQPPGPRRTEDRQRVKRSGRHLIKARFGALRRVAEMGMEWRGNGRSPRKTRRPAATSGTIPTCENPMTWPGIEPGSLWWEVSRLTAQQANRSATAAPTLLDRPTAFKVHTFKKNVTWTVCNRL